MRHLALVPPPEPITPRRPSAPVSVGDVVHVAAPIRFRSGGLLRARAYTALAVEATPPEHVRRGAWRVVVEAALDCSGLPETHRPGSEYRRRKGLAARPACAEPKRLYLYPGQFVVYAGDELATLPDHPLQND